MATTTVTIKCPECGALLKIEGQREVSYCSCCGTKVKTHNEKDVLRRDFNDSEANRTPSETVRAEKARILELAKKQLASAEKAENIKVFKQIASILFGGATFVFLIYALSTNAVVGYIISAICGLVLFLLWAKEIIGNKKIASAILGTIALIILIYGFIAKATVGYIIGGICGFFALMLFFDSLDHDDKTPDKKPVVYGRMCIVPSGIDYYENKSYITIEKILVEAGFLDVQCIPLHDLKFGIFNKPNTVESITIDGELIKEGGGTYPSYASIIISYHSKKES